MEYRMKRVFFSNSDKQLQKHVKCLKLVMNVKPCARLRIVWMIHIGRWGPWRWAKKWTAVDCSKFGNSYQCSWNRCMRPSNDPKSDGGLTADQQGDDSSDYSRDLGKGNICTKFVRHSVTDDLKEHRDTGPLRLINSFPITSLPETSLGCFNMNPKQNVRSPS
jgi:hypothetical protein